MLGVGGRALLIEMLWNFGAAKDLKTIASIISCVDTWRWGRAQDFDPASEPAGNPWIYETDLGSIRVDVVNLWPTLGWFNRSSASLCCSIKFGTSFRFFHLIWYSLWIFLSADMFAALVGSVVYMVIRYNCTDSACTHIGTLTFDMVMLLQLVLTMPAVCHSLFRRWSRIYSIAAGLASWLLCAFHLSSPWSVSMLLLLLLLLLCTIHPCSASLSLSLSSTLSISLTHTLTHTHIHSLSLVLVAVTKPKELKTKISHAHSLILYFAYCLSALLLPYLLSLYYLSLLCLCFDHSHTLRV